MGKPQFLCDECIAGLLVPGLRRAEPLLDVIQVGDTGAPPKGTLDPDLLIAAESLGRVLLTNDRQTMPGHLIDHFAAGRRTAGVILLRGGFQPGRYIQEIIQRWTTMTAADWVDRTEYIP